MDYKDAYERLNESVKSSEDEGLQFTALNIANDLLSKQQEQQQEEQQEKKKQEEQPSLAEKLARERNERTPKTNLWG